MSNQIAQNILLQLGGNRFKTMTGAKNFLAGDSYLLFTIPKCNKGGINLVMISLNGLDLYDMAFLRVKKKRNSIEYDQQVIAEVKNIYFDMLQTIFTEQTGLYTHL